ncbi:MAG: cytochrome c family protein [Desulfobacterales bacterium]|nr:cytochrome c family protein [Desulfobacterales bacterium]
MMFSRKELNLVYAGTVILLFLAVVSYAAFPNQAAETALADRVSERGRQGHVRPRRHLSEAGYGLACGECHHTLAPDEYDQAGSCTECHAVEEGDDQMPKRSDALHQQCIDCHREYGAGPVDCAQCHVMQ